LVRQIANILLVGVSAGWVVYFVENREGRFSGFDLRLLPYICFSATPILILRYRLQLSAATANPASSNPATATVVELSIVPAPEIPETLALEIPVTAMTAIE